MIKSKVSFKNHVVASVICVCSLLFSSLGVAQNSLQNSTELLSLSSEALSAFSSDFQVREGFLPTDELLGFEIFNLSAESIDAQMFISDSQNRLLIQELSCDTSDACTVGEAIVERSFDAPAGEVSLEEFGLAMKSALSIFDRGIGEIDQIDSIKLWRSFNQRNSGTYIQVEVVWGLDSRADETSYMFCHYHHGGPNIDCHRQMSAGPFQP